MMNKHAEINKANASPSEEPQSVPEFYANEITVNVSLMEIEIRNVLTDSDHHIKGAVNIRMSPQLARVFTKSLTQALLDYEKQFGKIPQPLS